MPALVPSRRMLVASLRFGLGALPIVFAVVACSSSSSSAGGAGGEDAGGDVVVKSGGPCRSNAECGNFESCYLPGQANCGIAPLNECALGVPCNARVDVPVVPDAGDEDAAADGGDAGAPDGVCVALGGCGGTQCLPRCKDDADCGGSLRGHCAVDTGRCGPPLCTTDAECKSPNLVCSTGALRTCVAKPCTADTECSGFCRDGNCSELGSCSLPAP
jgi:hypothetical protein